MCKPFRDIIYNTYCNSIDIMYYDNDVVCIEFSESEDIRDLV